MSADIQLRPGTDVEVSEAVAERAEDLIRNVQSAAEAEDLIDKIDSAQHAVKAMKLGEEQERRWKIVRLKGERRYGILLGPAKMGKRYVTGSNVSGSDRVAQNRAREVAAIPQDRFDDYIRTAGNPSRSGLLSGRTQRQPPARRTAEEDARVLKLHKQGAMIKDIVAKTGYRAETIRIILAEQKGRSEAAPVRGRPRNWNGKSNDMRLREIRQNDLGKLNRLAMDINRLCRILEDYRADDYTPDEDSVWHIAAIYEDLISLGEWVSRSLSATLGWLGDADVRKKIERLRDTHGRTSEEAETAQRLADLLERKLGARLEG